MLLEHGWKSLYSSGFIRHLFFSIMADECTDVTTIEELTIGCRWVESSVPEEHFIEILPLKKANAESIYSALVEYCREKNIQLGRLIGMGFDGAATFSGDKTGVQKRLKELSPHALFVHCHCHVLQLASVQAANAIPGIKHVYTTLMMLWKFFHYSPKICRVIKGDSERTRSSRAQDCETVRHMLACT